MSYRKSKASARQIQDTIYGEIVEARKEKNLSLLANAIRHLDDELKKIMASQIKVFRALQATFRVEGKIEWIAIPPIPQELASNYNARNLLIYSLIARLDMAKQLEQFLWQPLDDFVPIPYERRPSQLKEYDDSLTAMIVQGLTREAGELDERLRAKARYQLEADDGDYKKQGKARLHMKHILLFNIAQVEVAFQEMKNLQAEIVLPIDEYWWRSILIDPDFDHIHHFQVMKASNNRYRKRCEMNFRVTERQKVIREAAEKMIVSVESLQNSLKAFK